MKAPSISLENKVMESYLISNNDNPLPKTVKSKSIRMKRGSSKADKSIGTALITKTSLNQRKIVSYGANKMSSS